MLLFSRKNIAYKKSLCYNTIKILDFLGGEMDNESRKISNKELIEIYIKNKEFISLLEKEQKNAEKMRE